MPSASTVHATKTCAANVNGDLTSSQRYPTKCVGLRRPFGEARDAGHVSTPYRYTGQREMLAGLYDYRARWYEPALGRFLQPDSLIPQPGNPQDWDRYAYVHNSPLVYSDPSGHFSTCGDENTSSGCYSAQDYRDMALEIYGLSIDDTFGFSEVVNLFIAAERMDYVFNGGLKEAAGLVSVTHDSCAGGCYSGITYGTYIIFYGLSPYQNIYHEYAHAIDNHNRGAIVSNMGKLRKDNNGKIVFGYVHNRYSRNDTLGYKSESIWDPIRNRNVDALQHSAKKDAAGNTPDEDWADMFANYMAGNIDIASLDTSAGRIRQRFVTDVIQNTLNPIFSQIGGPGVQQ